MPGHGRRDNRKCENGEAARERREETVEEETLVFCVKSLLLFRTSALGHHLGIKSELLFYDVI